MWIIKNIFKFLQIYASDNSIPLKKFRRNVLNKHLKLTNFYIKIKE